MNTRPNSQLYIVSTHGTDKSEYLDEYVARGLASLGDPRSRVAFVDYGIPDAANAEDLDVIAAHHPAVGHTITRASLADSYEEFRHPETGIVDVAGWARAYGNRKSTVRELIFPGSVWTEAARIRQPIPDRAGLGFDVSPDGRHYCLAAGWHVADQGFVEILDAGPVHRELGAQVAAVARARRVPLVIDRQAAAALEVVDGFARLPEHERPEVAFLSLAQYGSACVTFSRGIFNDTVHHANDDDLDAAVVHASKRDLPEGGFGWTRKGTGNISPLVAATVALKAADMLPAATPRPRIVTATRPA